MKQHRLICGLLVLVSPDVPKLQLSDDVPVTPAFRAETVSYTHLTPPTKA